MQEQLASEIDKFTDIKWKPHRIDSRWQQDSLTNKNKAARIVFDYIDDAHLSIVFGPSFYGYTVGHYECMLNVPASIKMIFKNTKFDLVLKGDVFTLDKDRIIELIIAINSFTYKPVKITI
jgi:hypothetical protein